MSQVDFSIDMDQLHAENDATDILKLNDDCLIKVFECLDLLDLCAVADVCTSFRVVAEMCFEHSKKTKLTLPEDIRSDGDSVAQFCRKISNFLRHFGAHFTCFDENDMFEKQTHWSIESQATCRRRIIELLVQYCSGTLTALRIFRIDLSFETMLLMKPLLVRLQSLDLRFVSLGETFWHVLPTFAPELQDIVCVRPERSDGQILQFDGLYQPFPKLEYFTLQGIVDIKSSDIERMLKWNSQLKSLRFTCKNLDRQIFRSIAHHVPGVEILFFVISPSFPLLEQVDAEYIGRLKNLKSLEMRFFRNPLPTGEHIVSILREILAVNGPLNHLCLQNIDSLAHADRLVDGVSKLKKLERLELFYIKGLTIFHFQDICKYCTALRVLNILPAFIPTTKSISEMVRNAPNLEQLQFWRNWPHHRCDGVPYCVDIGVYNEWKEIVENRRDKRRLQIRLDRDNFKTNMTPIPITALKRAFVLSIGTGSSERDMQCEYF